MNKLVKNLIIIIWVEHNPGFYRLLNLHSSDKPQVSVHRSNYM